MDDRSHALFSLYEDAEKYEARNCDEGLWEPNDDKEEDLKKRVDRLKGGEK